MKITKKKARSLMRKRLTAVYPELIDKQIELFLSTFPADAKIIAYDSLPGEHDISSLGLNSIEDDLDDAINDPADIYLIPMIGVNSDKYRLGRGGGFYDRLLKKVPSALAVGIVSEHRNIEFQEEGHDVKMDVVITERGQK